MAHTLAAGLRALARLGLTLRREQVNGQPGALIVDREGRLVAVVSLDVAEGQVQGVSAIDNPDKLGHLGPLADLDALLRKRKLGIETRPLAGREYVARVSAGGP